MPATVAIGAKACFIRPNGRGPTRLSSACPPGPDRTPSNLMSHASSFQAVGERRLHALELATPLSQRPGAHTAGTPGDAHHLRHGDEKAPRFCEIGGRGRVGPDSTHGVQRVSRPPDTLRHRSEQYVTCSRSRSHFFRPVKGLPQAAQILVGRSEGGRCLGTQLLPWGRPCPLRRQPAEAVVGHGREPCFTLQCLRWFNPAESPHAYQVSGAHVLLSEKTSGRASLSKCAPAPARAGVRNPIGVAGTRGINCRADAAARRPRHSGCIHSRHGHP